MREYKIANIMHLARGKNSNTKKVSLFGPPCRTSDVVLKSGNAFQSDSIVLKTQIHRTLTQHSMTWKWLCQT